jgi:Xaa-Pro aminopeptidase
LCHTPRETGMTFNVEPAIYMEGCGAIRHRDVVTVTRDGAQILTPFHDNVEKLGVTAHEFVARRGACP